MKIRKALTVLLLATMALLSSCTKTVAEPESSPDTDSTTFFSSRGSGGHFRDRKNPHSSSLSPEASSEIEHIGKELEDIPDAGQSVTDYSELTRGYSYSQRGRAYFINPFAGILIDLTGWTQMDLSELADSFDIDPEALREWSGEDFKTNFVTPDLYAYMFDAKNLRSVMIMSFFENISLDNIAGRNRKEYLLFQMEQLASEDEDYGFSAPFTVTLSGKEFIGISCTYSMEGFEFTQYTLVRQYGDYMYNISIMGTNLGDIQDIYDLFIEIPDSPSPGLN